MTLSDIRVVTRGDDAGMCHTANIAIRDAVIRGILRNVSVMVPAPAFQEAVEIFSAMREVTIGLHVDLTAEWEHLRWGPVLPPDEVSTLVDEQGYFYQTGQGLKERGALLDHMQAEVRAQLQKARKAGLDVQYLDEHMGVGWINGLGEWLLDFCDSEGLVCSRELTQQGYLKSFPGVSDAENAVQRVLLGVQHIVPGTYLLVGHPAYMTEEMHAAQLPGQIPGIEAQSRDWQRRMFMDDKILALCRDHTIQPIGYLDVR